MAKLHIDIVECRVWELSVSHNTDDISVILSADFVKRAHLVPEVLVRETAERNL